MINETVLLESRTLRTSVLDRTHALDKVKTLSLLPDDLHVTTAMVAAYFEVAENAVRQVVKRHREELTENGMRTLRGADLQRFESDNLYLSNGSYPQGRAHLAVYTRRTILDMAMLLRDSEVARRVRTYLLDREQASRPRPVALADPYPGPGPHADDVESLDERISRLSEEGFTRLLSRTVVPMIGALVETSGEQRRELLSLRQDVEQIQQRLVEHDLQLSRLQRGQEAKALTGVIGTVDAMNGKEFELHVAGLLRRDGCTGVEVHGGHGGDRGTDITARTADGRTVAVQCKNFAPFRHVLSGEMQKFLGSSKVLHRAEVALYVATCAFTREALAIAAQGGVTAVHRGLLEAWSAGVRLQVLR
ncbi:restriction endonuclease [Streptomyces sp. NPDC051567]|uniref:restriction endonuclease n=1 Tax=Streptomyces sp. NPDC051567 TaxID=3365660 RepID=UPI00378FBF73